MKTAKRNLFLGEKFNIFFGVEIVFYICVPRSSNEPSSYWHCQFTQTSTTFGRVSHHSIPPTPHGDQIRKEEEIAPSDSEPSSKYLRLPMETGRVPQPIVFSKAILL
jgi:hypothetical protein